MRALSDRELTVSLLARQLLLERRQMPVGQAVRCLCALQAQYSPSPYLALHSRLDGFSIGDLESALRRRTVVKSTLMRGTLHLVTAADYPFFAAACHPQLSAGIRTSNRAAEPLEKQIVTGLAEFTAVPRTTDEIRQRVQDLSGGAVKRQWLLDYARLMVPMVHLAPSGLWQRHGKFSLVAWRDGLEPEPAATALLVRRYLAAFGPASREDVAAFTWLRYDLPRGPLPPEDVLVPPRLLARFDAAVLSHRDRTRILPAGIRDEVMEMMGGNLMPYLVDGLVAGRWSYRQQRDRAVLTLRPFVPTGGSLPADLEAEAHRMLSFVAPDAHDRQVELADGTVGG